MSTFYITTAISYVNGVPHLGHAYEAIVTDVLARHRRQIGEDVFFLTGTDEHGEPVADAAHALGVEPQELADCNAARFRALMPQLEISNDFFIRTTDVEHKLRVQEVLQRVHDRGYTYKGLYEGWYCPRCADFKVESEILEGNRCAIHEIVLTREQEENWFFRLSDFQEPLERLFAERPDFVMPQHHFNEARAFIASGLEDVSLSRARLKWGVVVPWDPGHVFYVWFDALLNYYTALGYARPGEDLTARYWPANFHIVGKDILKFHAVFWPAILMAAEIEVPRHVFVHGFLLGADGRKMSKSLGNVLDPFEVLERYGPDALRHYLCREVSFGQDGAVSRDGFQARYDSELANDYGNLASRTLNMIERYCDAVVPVVATDPALRAEFGGLFERVDALLERAELSTALEEIWQYVRRLNRYVEERAPWAIAREEARRPELELVLASLAEGLRVVTVALAPYMPAKTQTLLEALGASEQLERAFAPAGYGGTVGALAPLFPQERVIDSHTHLDVCAPPDEELVAAARAAGVIRMLTVGTDPASCVAALAAADRFEDVYAAIGCHPNVAEQLDVELLAELAAHPRCVAIGETGLDYYRDRSPREHQQRAFEAQIELARELDKPLVIHTREAAEDTLATLDERARGLRVILHCFSIPEHADACIAAGWWLSFAGNVTYPKSTALAAVAASAPLERLLVETDAPYLTPQSHRGTPNEPARVVETAAFIAGLRQTPPQEFEAALEANAAELFGW